MQTTRSTKRSLGLKHVVLLFVLAGIAVGIAAAPAAASSTATPCWKRVLNDWFVDGRIDGTYPPKCIDTATKHLGEDAKLYSSFVQEARHAVLAEARWQAKHPSKKLRFTFSPGSGGNGPLGPTSPLKRDGGGGPRSGNDSSFLHRAIDRIGPSNAESVPLPLLVLGGIAVLLLLAAAASFFARRVQARRLQTAPAPEPKRP